MAKNPFAPTFGTSPPALTGRERVLDTLTEALDSGPAHPAYTSILVGVRGAGKTVTLNAIEDEARRRGWEVIALDSTAGPITDQVLAAAMDVLSGYNSPSGPRLTSVKMLGQQLAFDHTSDATPESLRQVLSRLGDVLMTRETGLLITVDELQSVDPEQMRRFGGVIQHVTRREERPVAFVGAGLPTIEDTLLADDGATFLQRCERFDIDRISDRAVREALEIPVRAAGGWIDPTGLDEAVGSASGYAFMVQLIGFHTWRHAEDPTGQITRAEVHAGISEAERRIGELVLAPVWRGLSEMDRRFCMAMVEDEGPSTIADIARRLGRDSGYTGVYRSRLLKVGMIIPAGHGQVDFAHHATRRWLQSLDSV